MSLKLRARTREGIAIVDVIGSMEDNAQLLRDEVSKCIEAGKTNIVLNLEEATYLNSTWLGAIVQNFMRLSQAGGKLKLLNLPKKIMDVFVMSKLSMVFDIFTSEDDAINSFFASRPLNYPHALQRDPGGGEPPAERPRLRVFLCHSSTDKAAVRDLRQRLLQLGVKPWLDEVDLLPGQLWEKEIPAAVRGSDAIVVCLSQQAVGATGYLQREIKYALDAAEEQSDESIFIIPSRLEECDVPERLRKWQWVDLFAADGYDRLATALQARALALQKKLIRA
jgi:anti-anti-sigma factor